MSEAEAKKRTTIFRADGVPMCGKRRQEVRRGSRGSAPYVGAAQQVGIQAGVKVGDIKWQLHTKKLFIKALNKKFEEKKISTLRNDGANLGPED